MVRARGVTFRLVGRLPYGPGEPPASERFERAAKWAIDSDGQFRSMIDSGQSPVVAISSRKAPAAGRADRQSLSEYRAFALRVASLVVPVLLDPPQLERLYPFQRDGVRWLLDHSGGILADDMGLGKTVQVVTALSTLFNRGEVRTAVVVCPKGLIPTWEREFARWAPELGIAMMTPPKSIREEAWRAVAGRRHVLLTNYEHLRTPPEELLRNAPDVFIADEAHRVRKRGSRVTSGIAQLRPNRFWALSGTPLERNHDDLATLLSLVAPARFSPNDSHLHPSSLRSRARGFLLRRRKSEVLEQLPPVRDTTEALEMNTGQRRAYRKAILDSAGEPGDELALLTRLLSICDLDPESRESSKLERILSLLPVIRESDEKAVVFSHRLDPLHELEARLTAGYGKGSGLLLVGAMGSVARERTLHRFRNDERAFVLLASTRIGGEGLTLTEANHVFLINQWWNPSLSDQARDRVRRIGQRRSVRVYRFCCRGTLEEDLERILKRKRGIFDDLVDRLANDRKYTLERHILSELGAEKLREHRLGRG